MEVKDAVEAAKSYVAEMFVAETVSDVLLEEVRFEELPGEWAITIGFRRRGAEPVVIDSAVGSLRTDRSFKVVRVRDRDGSILSMADRLLTPVP